MLSPGAPDQSIHQTTSLSTIQEDIEKLPVYAKMDKFYKMVSGVICLVDWCGYNLRMRSFALFVDQLIHNRDVRNLAFCGLHNFYLASYIESWSELMSDKSSVITR